MENKRGVIGIVGTLLIVVMVIMISSPSNSADEEAGYLSPYDEVLRGINDSIDTVQKNNDRMKAIDNDVKSYKNQLEGMLESYDSLRGDMEKNLERLERLGDVVDRTKQDSNDVEEKLSVLKSNVEKNEEMFIVENSGIRISPIFLLAFLFVNCIVWVQISGYYKKKYA